MSFLLPRTEAMVLFAEGYVRMNRKKQEPSSALSILFFMLAQVFVFSLSMLLLPDGDRSVTDGKNE